MKKALLIILALITVTIQCGWAESTEKYNEMPQWLVFSQTTEKNTVHPQVLEYRTYPITQNTLVNQEMKTLIDQMADQAKALLPKQKKGKAQAYADTGAYACRTGESIISFLVISRIDDESIQTYVKMTTRVYDIKTGRQITLDDLFENDAAYSKTEDALREQLTAYFPDETPDPDAPEAVCTADAIRNANFTLGVTGLYFHYQTEDFYPSHQTLLHVYIPYSSIMNDISDYAKQITDVSRFQLIALTYDDGPAPGSTNRVLNTLRAHGANATFFIVGRCMKNNKDMVARIHDSGFSPESHGYNHEYNLTSKQLLTEKERFNQEMSEIVGVSPKIVRAPGGIENPFIKAEYGVPLIRWSVMAGDATIDQKSSNSFASAVYDRARDGDIVLMHDSNAKAFEYSDLILEKLENKGFLFVTVEELFALKDIPLKNDVVYHNAYQD